MTCTITSTFGSVDYQRQVLGLPPVEPKRVNHNREYFEFENALIAIPEWYLEHVKLLAGTILSFRTLTIDNKYSTSLLGLRNNAKVIDDMPYNRTDTYGGNGKHYKYMMDRTLEFLQVYIAFCNKLAGDTDHIKEIYVLESNASNIDPSCFFDNDSKYYYDAAELNVWGIQYLEKTDEVGNLALTPPSDLGVGR